MYRKHDKIAIEFDDATSVEQWKYICQAWIYCAKYSLPDEEIIPTAQRWFKEDQRELWKSYPLLLSLYHADE